MSEQVLRHSVSLATQLSARASAGFAAIGLDENFGQVRRSDRPDLADFQCNGALAAAKQARRPPVEIASDLVGHLSGCPEIARAEIAGPGFINIVVSDEALAQRLDAIGSDPKAGGGKAGRAETRILDFGGLNVAKPMHVGHLRSLIIGDSLQRLFRFRGHRVISDLHLGDWGLQMGMLVAQMERESPHLPWFEPGAEGGFPETSPVTLEDLERLYPEASAASRQQPERMQQARLATAKLQAGLPGYRALWRHFIALTREALKREFSILGVHFDLWQGESDAEPLIPEMLRDLQARGLTHEHEGALIFPVRRESDDKEYPPLILRNARSASSYHTTDLATIIQRVEAYSPDRILYVVDQRQALHFEQVFRAADKAGYISEERLEHLGFGTMNGSDGKPFRTREGGVLKLGDFLGQALAAARERLQETGVTERLESSECEQIAEKIALAAIKFADLSNMRTSNYVFDLSQFIAFEGCTGPYLLYAAVRIKSLLRRAEAEGVTPALMGLSGAEDRAVILVLDGFAHTLAEAERKRTPHLICEHVFALAQVFSVFYAKVPIMNEPDAEIRAARLGLAQAVLHQLETGLSLIGIEVPERM